MAAFWNVAPSDLVDVYRRLKRSYCLLETVICLHDNGGSKHL
jgi:hypothetical protein